MSDTTPDTRSIEEGLQAAILKLYGEVAENPNGDYHFFHGAEAVKRFAYDPALLTLAPAGAVASFAGVGNPLERAALEPGEHVLDLGSGAGLDSILAAKQVGASGKVYGVDFNAVMREKAASHATESSVRLELLDGHIESVPLPDESVDVIISNGVVNLSLRKGDVFSEMFRVLRPGGRISICDIVSARAMPPAITEDPNLWAS